MQKHIFYSIFSISTLIAGAAVARAATDLSAAMVDVKIATISQMYQQDAESEGFGDIPILVEYGTPELQSAFALEQDYYEREQMSCNVGHDVLWDSQDPDYLQKREITMADNGLVKVSLAQGDDIYYELVCDNTNNKSSCEVNDVMFANKISLKDYLFENCR